MTQAGESVYPLPRHCDWSRGGHETLAGLSESFFGICYDREKDIVSPSQDF